MTVIRISYNFGIIRVTSLCISTWYMELWADLFCTENSCLVDQLEKFPELMKTCSSHRCGWLPFPPHSCLKHTLIRDARLIANYRLHFILNSLCCGSSFYKSKDFVFSYLEIYSAKKRHSTEKKNRMVSLLVIDIYLFFFYFNEISQAADPWEQLCSLFEKIE